ncbi:1-deoxy-D-xylulose 5-phosphate synthase, putative [Plasmodium berghei]|uniref:1-deoxy-D-xylulose-5-phosphate synthase n=2 Tax=Plasmodium berghei TaxID=5821 RepID=A0A509AXZ7_PLABA|nr:1-deoxy-D-xylulose 5-phosphate synthase, putative [Plasmodium berghei ANKA]CXJ01844.1 1-deoxy-D-xylulose 5-phosphate synthase, putative [Plasmodium berghei]SCL98227.1 1-deoxy-D-xylulose 5-phosphate synthase, putative [Plasmodium berghei]SCM16783.1 1-deoxy-D-xylulose 5-phosphate synthase, putative [Plasmodium berghei]SCM18581.1 1-deoxy-D-xylulose 5-phosphate synthase, putative [Plasmodium berghei]SCN28014.1 1-deoxy-D-xylulose 5-phosphate synthase, putative [Plasmodium berghei]|eukprot:XP_034423667.1 1-deoxy-D-xylulose 5-phosphate synthase, putative [Plasmodium berghei ANKA]
MFHAIPFLHVLCVALMLIHINNPFVCSNIKKCNKHMASMSIYNFTRGGNLCGRFKNMLPRFIKILSYKNFSPYKKLEEVNEPNICYKGIDNFKQYLYKNNGKQQVTKNDKKSKTYKNKSKLLFINSSKSPHFNLKKKWNKNEGLNYLFNRKLIYTQGNYGSNVYSKIFNSEKKNYSIHSLGDTTNSGNIFSNNDKTNNYENYNGNNLDRYFDEINKYINVDIYKNKYGEEIYNEIVNLYVKRDIPKNYEQKYFFRNVKKSIIFDMDKYNDEEFEKKIEEEFTNNGVLINTINKKYYSKKYIKRMITILNYLPLLKIINTPTDLKNLKKIYLPLLSHELKIFHFFLVNITGGHFSPSLSLLELQLSLLYIFNPPLDEIIYDIGHQTYIHKILTGRKLLFLSLRQKNGISGFLNIFESIYDKFGAGHSSTALSAIQGIYEADWQVLHSNKKGNDILKNEDNYDRNCTPNKFYISIIGDGGLTGGMALEALNYISFLNSKVLIIYNDNRQVSLPTNGKCISGNKPIGAISDHLYDFVKKNGKIIGSETLNEVNHYNSKESNINESDKNQNIFTNINYNYIGPIDGNNIENVIKILEDIKNKGIQKSTILHILTKKSSDFINSKSPINIMHSIKKNEIFKFNLEELDSCHEENNNINEQSKKEDNEKNYTIINDNEIFSNETYINIYTKEMLKYLEKNKNIIFISPAMLGGSGLLNISKKYPKNVYDVGIAEQHAVTFSASMSMNKNLNIHLHIYSTFMQRAYDQIIHDLNLQKIPLNIIINRSGLVGEDGATHQGIYDLSYLGVLNNSTIISPSNDISLKKALKYCSINRKEGSIFIRLPKVNTLSNSYMENYLNMNIMRDIKEIEKIENPEYARNNYFGKSQIIQMSNPNKKEKEGKKLVCIFNMGSMLYNIVNAIKEIEKDPKFSEQFSFSIVDMIFLNPMDKNIIDYVINKNKHDYLITYEDNTLGGFYTHFNNYLIEKNYISKNKLSVKNIYFPNHPIEHATYKEQQEFVKMDHQNLIYRIKNYLTNNF